ncbi:SEL1-like repeat protein [Aggregatibacter kilianii]|uniref:SEL1-like repeat protein n=1 Tax=Aggregatibacter kilianii TaxID=2025884 RepID=UPI000D64C93A|nr:tetratricopeptide repeat protein [Aggregatibacter kilianii]
MLKTISIIVITVLNLNTPLDEIKTPQNSTALLTSQQAQMTTEQVNALFEEGFDYRYGITQPINNKKANELLKQAADLGNADAAFFYALNMINDGNLDEAEIYTEKARVLGNDKEPYLLAEIGIERGMPEALYTEDYRQAFNAMKNAVDKGDLHYVNLVGYSYRYGIGTKENTKKAIAYFKLGAKQGNTLSMGHLSEIYLEQDKLEQAEPFLFTSAEKNNPVAQYNLAYHVFEPGDPKYIYWMERAAENNNVDALNALGVHYDGEKAIAYLQKAIDLGDDLAPYLLSTLYREGEDVPADKKKYREYLALAGERGNIDALGALISWAVDEKDDEKGIYWMKKAYEIDEGIFEDFKEEFKNSPRYQEILAIPENSE